MIKGALLLYLILGIIFGIAVALRVLVDKRIEGLDGWIEQAFAFVAVAMLMTIFWPVIILIVILKD